MAKFSNIQGMTTKSSLPPGQKGMECKTPLTQCILISGMLRCKKENNKKKFLE